MKLSKINHLFHSKPFVIVGLIILLGLVLRCINLQGSVIFAYDQARDAQRVMEMVFHHDIKLVGPETDIPGVFNGVLYYFILAPIYLMSGFDPTAVAVIFILFNLTVIYMLYELALILFNNKYIGYVAGFLWAISYEQINFAKYVSNASLMPVSTTLFFFGLALFIFRKKNIGLILSAVGLAASIHFNFYLVYLFIFYPIFFFIYRPKLKPLPILISAGILTFMLLPFAIAELKWHFAMTKGLMGYFANHTKDSNGSFNPITVFWKYYERIAEMVNFTFFTFQRGIGTFIMATLMIVGLWRLKKIQRLFLIVCIFSTLPLFVFNSGVLTVQVINSSVFFAYTLAVAAGLIFLLESRYKIIAIVIVMAFVASNFLQCYRDGFRNNTMFASFPLQTRFEKQIVDYTYQSVDKKPFSICTVSNPLFSNTIWSFMYKNYGEKKYRYLPTWAGQKQFINTDYLPIDLMHEKNRFLIIESVGVPDFAKRATIYLEDKKSSIVEQKNFGEFIVQKRRLYDVDNQFIDTQNLQRGQIDDVNRLYNEDPRYSCFTGY